MRGRSHAVRQAKKLLNQYYSTSGHKIDPENFEIDIHLLARHLNINVLEHPFSDKISGVFFKKEGKLFLGVNSKHHPHRQRFTLAHEIGHYILHSEDPLHYDLNLSEEGDRFLFRAENVSSLEEIEANIFAAEILMPAKRVEELIDRGVLSIQELANKFNVSSGAMKYRLINLGYL